MKKTNKPIDNHFNAFTVVYLLPPSLLDNFTELWGDFWEMEGTPTGAHKPTGWLGVHFSHHFPF
jgi:hypothetical protein